ncbi:hypothetical protein ABH926_008571 [Catenulispora sp. GP43]|uniref:leucine-rich repeat domain-containing protein n=1 Tax=Catenulispora sp. GP43 TaxID=3156263 RepID=UPI003515B8CE
MANEGDEAARRIEQAFHDCAAVLDLAGVEIRGLPESIGNLTALTTLDLSETGLTVLPESIGNLTALTTLDLSETGLTVLPESIGNLTALTTLDLSETGLTVLPESIGNLTVSLPRTPSVLVRRQVGIRGGFHRGDRLGGCIAR